MEEKNEEKAMICFAASPQLKERIEALAKRRESSTSATIRGILVDALEKAEK